MIDVFWEIFELKIWMKTLFYSKKKPITTLHIHHACKTKHYSNYFTKTQKKAFTYNTRPPIEETETGRKDNNQQQSYFSVSFLILKIAYLPCTK